MSDNLDIYDLNDGHVLEAVDRLHVACMYLDEVLGSHPLLCSVPKFKADIDMAIETLAKLYQEVGSFNTIKDITAAHKLVEGYRAKP